MKKSHRILIIYRIIAFSGSTVYTLTKKKKDSVEKRLMFHVSSTLQMEGEQMFYDIQEQYYIEVELIEPMKKFCGQFDRRIYVYTSYMILHITRQYNSVTYSVTY